MPLIYSTLSKKRTTKSDYLNDQVYNLLDKTFELPKRGFSFNVYVVSKDYIARPDLISYDVYNDTRYADIICKINGISNPFELNEGMELIIPVANDIHKFEASTDAISNTMFDDEINDRMPVAKSKNNTKRKANEAVVGDSRFKIDSAAGIIIY